LIHPDQCGDEATRRLADLQMKRLNGILEILTDAGARADYDRSLAALASCVSGEPALQPFRRWEARWTGPLAASCSTVLLVVLLALSPLRPPVAAPVLARPAGAIPAKGPRPERSAAAHPPQVPHSEPEVDWEPLATYAYGSHVPIPPMPFPDQLPPPPVREPAASTENASARLAAVLAGDWLLVPTTSPNVLGYPPEYIELRIRDEGDRIHGRYRARYRIADSTISPTVAFQFEGPAAAEGGTMSWRGDGGSKGEVTLRLLPGGDLEVTWEAAELGNELGLISGTATLVRRLE
jgi:hypothetical protein